MTPLYFSTPADLRAWFEQNHETTDEMWLGYYKKGTGTPSVTWPESVDEALCFGWIDGLRKSIDSERYMIRFTPRRADSIWSAVNIQRVKELQATGRMQPAGERAFALRQDEKSAVYAHEQRQSAQLPDAYLKQLQGNSAALAFFQSQPPSYQRAAVWWIISAKQEATQLKRLATLIADSEAGHTVAPLTRPSKAK